jgi:glycosyltransferase involved in cell wall biosynthesis
MSNRLAVGAARRNVLHLVGDGLAGGGTTIVLQLARGLAERGLSVTVGSQDESYILDQAAKQGLPVLPLDFTSRRNTVQVTRALRSYLCAHPDTVVHAHGARAGLPASLLPGASHAGLVYTVHGFHYGDKPAGLRHLAMATERFCISRADVTVLVSQHDADRAAKDRLLPRGAVTRVIHNGAAPVPPVPQARTFDIAFLGRLHAQKNPSILPNVLKALRPARPSLCIIGSGDLEPALRSQVERAGLQEQVTFLGALDHADALAALAQARILLLPSLWEGLPVSVLEAMHRGIPVVASDVPGTDELVIDGVTGYLVPTQDAQAYAERIARLLADAALRARFGAEAIMRVREHFSIDGQLAAHAALYATTCVTTGAPG